MRITKKGWLVLGLCLVLVVSLVFNAGQALRQRSVGSDALNALSTDVDSALANLDSAVYLDTNQTNWSDASSRLAFYKSLLQARESSAAAAQLAPLNSGDPAAVAVRMGELQARLDATYLPAAQNLAEGRVTTADRSSLDSFCSSVRQAGWPLRAQLRDSGWGKLRASLDALSQLLGQVPSVIPVINVPDYSEDQSAYSSGKTTTKSQPSVKSGSALGITVKVAPASGA
jgi:23S rRNA C2498 (ribose-2'-O)-methylase RlmM